MRKLWLVGGFAILLMAFWGSPSLAASQVLTVNFANAPEGTHFVGKAPNPTCTASGATVTCPAQAFELAGVGNTNATATLTVQFSAIVDCFNPGTNPNNPVESHTQSVAVTTTSGLLSPKNGRLTISPLTASAPTESQFQASATCPNPNWTPVVRPGSITFTTFIFTVTFQGFSQPAIMIVGTA